MTCGGDPSRPAVRLRDLSSNGTEMFAKPMSTFLLTLPSEAFLAEDGGRFLARRLAAAYDRFQSHFPENAQVKVTEDGWRLSSDI